MFSREPLRVALAALVVAAGSGCGRDFSTLEPAPPITDPVVFDDDFGETVDFQAFMGSELDAVSIDTDKYPYEGSAALRVDVAPTGIPGVGFAGGAFPASMARDLSGYNALTFWAKSSLPTLLDVAGLGNDNTGTSKFEASWSRISLSLGWKQYIVPIPLPSKLTSEGGMFFFAEGPDTPTGHQIWFDDVRFAHVEGITNPSPSMKTETISAFVGATVQVSGTQVAFDVRGATQIIQHLPGYFTFFSSDPNVAEINDGVIQVVGNGTTTITAKLDDIDVAGEVTVIASAPPATSAPAPSTPQGDVISLFSNAYNDVNVNTWSADWDRADLTDMSIAGDDFKAYTNLVFAGIEFTSPVIDASQMTHFHIDVWLPEGVPFPEFKVKLVDFGADGIFSPDDTEHELSFRLSSNPPIRLGSWVSLDLPLADFTRLASVEHLAQLVLAGNTGTVYVDNIYFRR